MALLAPSQLLRRDLRVVGRLPVLRRGERRLAQLDDRRAAHHQWPVRRRIDRHHRAARAQLSGRSGVSADDGKQWRGEIRQHGLDTGLVTPADVLRFVPPAEFVRDAPLAVMAEMIRTGLTKGNFDPDIVLQHLTPKVMAENLQTSLLWACLADAVARHFEIGAQPQAASAVKDTGPIITSAAVEKLA